LQVLIASEGLLGYGGWNPNLGQAIEFRRAATLRKFHFSVSRPNGQ
jgi:hypothetical protein